MALFGPSSRTPSAFDYRRVWGDDSAVVRPGESIEARLHSLPLNVLSLRLADGHHFLHGLLRFDREVEVYGTPQAFLHLYGTATVLVSKPGSLAGLTLVSEDTHTQALVDVQDDDFSIADVAFTKVDTAKAIPLQIHNNGCHVHGCYFVPDSGVAAAQNFVWFADGLASGHVAACYLGRVAGGRHYVSFQGATGLEIEAGQAGVIAGATYRSYCNYADVEVRV